MTTTPELITLLQRHDAAELAWRGSSVHAALAARPDVAAELAEVANDRTRPSGLRMKALEAARGLGVSVTELDAAALAEIYTAAFAATGEHDAWGFPSSHPGGSGAGARLVACGPAALPALRPLLDDASPLVYEGSEEPTLAELRGYRKMDLAATWVAAILGEPFDVERDDPSARDADIARLRARTR